MRVLHPEPVRLTGQKSYIAGGRRGIRQTIKQMRALVCSGRADPFIVQSARAMLLQVVGKDTPGEMRELFSFVRDHVRYVSDVVDVETISPAWYTLHTRSGDCDDKSVLLATLLEAVGIQTRFVVTGYNAPGEFEHVYVRAFLPNGTPIDLDSTEPHPMGWSAPDPVIFWLEPWDDSYAVLDDLMPLAIFALGLVAGAILYRTAFK